MVKTPRLDEKFVDVHLTPWLVPTTKSATQQQLVAEKSLVWTVRCLFGVSELSRQLTRETSGSAQENIVQVSLRYRLKPCCNASVFSNNLEGLV